MTLKELEIKYGISKPTTQTKTSKTLTKYGYEIPEEPKKTTLSRVLDTLRTGEYAMGGLLAGKGAREGIRQKISPSTVLGVKGKISKLAVDILFDPTTYLTFGYGGVAKITSKTGAQIVLSRAGTKLLKQTTKKVGEKSARKSVAKIIAEGGVKAEKKYLAKGGIKFMGQQIVPRKIAVAPFKGADIALAKMPLVGEKYVRGKELLGKAFKPFSEIEKMPAQLGGKGVYRKGIFMPYTKGMRAEITRAVEPIIKAGKVTEKAIKKPWYKITFKKPKAGEELAEIIERGEKIVKPKAPTEAITGVSGSKVLDDLAEWIRKEHSAMLKAEKTRGITKTELPNYLRHFLTDKGRKFLDAGGSLYTGISKSLRVKLGAAKPRKLTGTIKEINQAMKNKVGGDFFEPDAFKAFAGRKVEHIKAVNTYDFLQRTGKQFGRPAEYTIRKFKSPVGAAERKAKAIQRIEKNIKSLKYDLSKVVSEIDKKGLLDKIKLQEVFLGITKKKDWTMVSEKILKRTIIDGVEFVESTAPQLKGLVLPKPIAKHIDETSQFLQSEEVANVFLRNYDKLLAFWKGTVTGYFPAFHTRNFMGGVFNNWLAGLKNPLRYKQAERILSEGKKYPEEIGEAIATKIPKVKPKLTTYTTSLGTKYTSLDILKLAKKHGVTGQTGMMDVMRQVQKEIGRSKFSAAGDYPRFLMETVENRLRLPLFVDRLMKGDTAQEAAEWVFKFHFDYTPEGLTVFERSWMKRLIPFYRWSRGNIPLQIEQMIKQPAKYASLEKTRQSITGEIGKEEFEYLPDWMREQFTMRIGEEGGKSLWLQLDLPMEDIAKLPIDESGLRELVSMLSPALKFPVERYMNKDIYFGGEIVDPLLKDYPELQTRKTIELLKHLPEPIKKFLNFRKVQYRDYSAEAKTEGDKKIFSTRYEMDARKLHIMRTAIGRFYMSAGQLFDKETAAWIKGMRLLGGVPVRPYDIEEEKDWRQWELEKKEEATMQYLKKHEIIPYKGAPRKSSLEELEKKYGIK